MNRSERRLYLIGELLREKPEYKNVSVPDDEPGQRRLLRSLFNVRQPSPITREFEEVQDAYLKEVNEERGIVTLGETEKMEDGIYLWQGDITRLKVDAIVNAANSGMTGCYTPCHSCIDNCIHTYAGIQMRNYCQALMDEQGHAEPVGRAKITPGFNLPCRFVIHTVGPFVSGRLTDMDEEKLSSCYRSCLDLACENSLASIAFCCISTGVFMFPNGRASEIAVQTVREYRKKNKTDIEVIFNVWKEIDYGLYRKLLGKNTEA